MASRTNVGWSALPDDLIFKICDCFLSTEDLDYYAAFWAVYGQWRRATPKPDFYLTKWIVVEHSLSDDAGITFLNLVSGRMLQKKMSQAMNRYYFIGAANGGLLVLGHRLSPYKTRILNPLTGAMTRFRAQIPVERLSAVAVTKSHAMIFVSNLQNQTVRWADWNSPEGETASGFGDGECSLDYLFGVLSSITTFEGELCTTDDYGAIMSTNTQSEPSAYNVKMVRAITGPTFEHARPWLRSFYLMESEGELLLVIGRLVVKGVPVVYRVDTKALAIEPVNSIGRRALFVGLSRSISVDGSIFRTVQSGGIYYADPLLFSAYDYDTQAWEDDAQYMPGHGVDDLRDSGRPYRWDETLAGYYRRTEFSEFQMAPNYDTYDGYRLE